MPLVVGVAGGSASGKTLVCDNVIRQLRDSRIVTVSMDSFYRDLRPDETPNTYNFDHPRAFDFAELKSCIESLRERKPTKIPRYDFKANARIKDQFDLIECADIVLVEGILTFHEESVSALFDMRIFVEEESDVRLMRRLRRDTNERGKHYLEIIAQYETNVKPMFDAFVHPQRKLADLILPNGGQNKVAIDMLCRHFKSWLQDHAGS